MDTLAFLKSRLVEGQRLLEVGCGDGALAAQLVGVGIDVVPIDTSSEMVSLAQQRGVPARQADFLTFEDDPFDVVFFSRSLHHIEPLDAAAEKAAALLTNPGRVMVEDFAVEAMDTTTALWFYGLASVVGAFTDGDYSPEMPADPLVAWREQHRHDHHTIASRQTMIAALRSHFRRAHEENPPYLYRYLGQTLVPDTERRSAVSASIRDWELAMINRQQLRAVGWRSVWIPRDNLQQTARQ